MTIQKIIGIGEMKTTNIHDGIKKVGDSIVETVLSSLQSVNGKVSVQ